MESLAEYILTKSENNVEKMVEIVQNFSDHIDENLFDSIVVIMKNSVLEPGYPIMGIIFSDKKLRFADGEIIITGDVEKLEEPIDGIYLAYTKNSRYLVIT